MPFTLNGIGTHYYGRRNASAVHGTCPQCGQQAQLSSYDTTECFCILFIPLIPVGKHRIESECSRCRRHYRIPLAQFNTIVAGNVTPLREAIRHDPGDPQRREALIRELIAVRLTADAEAEAREAAIAFPDNDALNHLAGELAAERGDLAGAEGWGRRALAANPRNLRARMALGRTLTLLGRNEEAIRELQAGLSGDPSAPALHLLASNQIALERWSDALATLQRLMGLSSEYREDRRLLRTIAECKTKLGYLLSEEERKASRRLWPFRRKAKVQLPHILPLNAASVSPAAANLSARGIALVFLVVIAAVVVIGGSIGWWRQTHVHVYFDNALGRPLTVQLDGERFPLTGRPPLRRDLKPGRHSIIVLDGDQELERLEADVAQEPFFKALWNPPFYVYNTAEAGIYHRANLVYATNEADQRADAQLVALQRWIRQESADFVFTAAPEEVSVDSRTKKAKRTLFDIAGSATFRGVAYARYSEGKSDDALRALKKGIALAPCDDDLRGDVINLLMIEDQVDQAGSHSREWVAACAESVNAHRRYQDLQRMEGRKDALLAEYGQRVLATPTAANHYLHGRLLSSDSAMAEYEEALRLDPGLTWARVALGSEMLIHERDSEAFAVLGKALETSDPDGLASRYYAMAAVGLRKESEALEFLAEARLDASALWQARWILTQSKEDWPAAQTLLATREKAEGKTAESSLLGARLARNAGEPMEELIEELRKSPETAEGADILAFEQTLQAGRVTDAAALEGSKLRTEGSPTLYSVYAVEAAMLSRAPGTNAQLQSLRAQLSAEDPFQKVLLALLDGLEGRITPQALMKQMADDSDVSMTKHAWFALGVRASVSGDRAAAARLFRKSADRALDREFPYRWASKLAESPPS